MRLRHSSYDSGDKRSCKNEFAHFCMRLGRPQTRGSSHFALFILDFAKLSVQNERIPSGCRLLHASGMRLATTEPGGETREQLRCEAIRRIRLLSMQSSYELSRHALAADFYLFRRSTGYYPPAFLPAAWSHINDIIRIPDHIKVMLYHNNGGTIADE